MPSGLDYVIGIAVLHAEVEPGVFLFGTNVSYCKISIECLGLLVATIYAFTIVDRARQNSFAGSVKQETPRCLARASFLQLRAVSTAFHRGDRC